MTAATYDSSAYGYAEVNATTPSLTQSDPTIEFSTGETWDCSTIDAVSAAAGQTMPTVNIGGALQTEMADCDEQYAFNSSSNNIECWQLEERN